MRLCGVLRPRRTTVRVSGAVRLSTRQLVSDITLLVWVAEVPSVWPRVMSRLLVQSVPAPLLGSVRHQ